MTSSTSPTGAGAHQNVAGAPQPTELVFGRYQIIRRLAVGGMGEVFLARQSGVAGFDRLVILKSLLPDLAAQQDFVDQFLDEARVAATLNHPNIVSIYEVGLWNGTYFIAMEYIKGDNLSRLQRAAERAKRPMPLEVAAYIMHDAAQALDHAHKATDLQGRPLHIVHRDVSPQNIMVRTDGVTKVVDFGIAKAANRSSRTATGLLKGKVQYMAPEQVQGAELDGRADQFALGVVLWELCAGRKLFQGNSDIDILKSVLQAPIPPLQSQVADVHPGLSACVDRMLERNRDVRYPTLAEAAHDLKRYLDVVGLKNAQQSAATFVGETLGDEIASKTVDLTPSGANNFVINLAQSAPPPTAPTAHHDTRKGKAAVGIAAGLGTAVLLGAAALWIILSGPGPDRGPAPPPQPPAPKLAIATIPQGALITLDGAPVGKSPMTVELKPDTAQEFVLKLDGYEPLKWQTQLKAGSMESYMKELKKLPVTLKLASEPSGAEVKKDGKVIGKTPLEIKLVADEEHELRLASGKKFGQLVLTGKPGAVEEKRVILKEGPPPCPEGTYRVGAKCLQKPTVAAVPVGEGFLTVKTTPWAKIAIDGKPYGTTPIAKVPLSAGVHTVKLMKEGAGPEVSKKVTITAGQVTKADWPL